MGAGDQLSRRPIVVDACLAVALAAFALAAGHGLLIQIGFLDPWFYTGFTFNFADLAERFGPTYYSLRVAHILPSAAFHALLGPVGGYVAFKFVLIALLFVCLAQVGRGFLAPWLARVLAAAFVLHPWVLRSLSWDYCDGTGVVYLTVLLVFLNLLVQDTRGRTGMAVCAGAALAMASNSNLFLIPVGGALCLWPVVGMVADRQWGRILRMAVLGAVGFFAGFVVLVLARYLAVPSQGLVFDIFGVSTGTRMATGDGEVWHENVVQLILSENRWYLLVPVLVLGMFVAAWLTAGRERRSPAILGVGLVLASTVAGFCVTDFLLKVAVISLPYYFVYITPTVFLGTVATLSLLVGHRESSAAAAVAAWVLLIGGFLAALPLYENSTSVPIAAVVSLGVIVACVAMLIWVPRGRARWCAFWVALIAVASQVTFFVGHGLYRPIGAEGAQREWDLYLIGASLFDRIDDLPRDRTEFAFWYPNQPKAGLPADLDSLNSLFLWSRTRVEGPDEVEDPGLPDLSADDETRLRKYRNVVLISWSQEDVDRGIEVLKERVGIVSSRSTSFESGPLILHAEMVTIPDQKELRRQQRREERQHQKETAGELAPG